MLEREEEKAATTHRHDVARLAPLLISVTSDNLLGLLDEVAALLEVGGGSKDLDGGINARDGDERETRMRLEDVDD